MKPLTAGNVGNYTNDQLKARLLGPSAAIGPRFEVYDLGGQKLSPDPTSIISAKYSFDATRLVPSSLQIEMAGDDPALPLATTYPFRVQIQAYFRIRMADGGTAEWPVGRFLHVLPERKIQSIDRSGVQSPVSTYSVTLPSATIYRMVIGGPGLTGFSLPPSFPITGGIAQALQRAMPYPPSLAGIVTSTQNTAGSMVWQLLSQANPTDNSANAAGAPATSWMQIEQVLHAGLGYMAPWEDWTGVYQAQPMPANLFAATPQITFTLDSNSITETPIGLSPRLDLLANRVFAAANNPNPNAQRGAVVVDANDYLPSHPFAQKNCHQYVDATLTNPVSADLQGVQASAVAELYKRMCVASDLSFTTQAWPGIEPWDVIQLTAPGDWTTSRLVTAQAWDWDLFTGQMNHKPASISGS